MDLYARLRYHRDALAALKSYGNGDGARASAARAALDEALAEVPPEAARLRIEAQGLLDAELPERADELYALAAELEDFQADPTRYVAPEPVAKRKGRRNG